MSEVVERLPAQVPDTVPELHRFLQGALELEHMTIPPYLTAMYTLRPGQNRAAYDAMRSVVVEEMLHMTLVANVFNAVGGQPNVAHPEFVKRYPARLPYSGLQLMVALRHFSPEALDTFLTIEHPGPPDTPPDDRGWRSISQFHAALRTGLQTMVAREGEEQVFTGDPARQLGPDDLYNSGGEVIRVTDLDSALRALDVIVDQGEGAGGAVFDSDDAVFGQRAELAHYFRFHEIRQGRRYAEHDTAASGPTGPAMDVRWDGVYRINPTACLDSYPVGSAVRGHAEEFNLRYAELLHRLQDAFTGKRDAMRDAIPAMLALKYQAITLIANPYPGRPGVHASPTFEIGADELARAATRLDTSASSVR